MAWTLVSRMEAFPNSSAPPRYNLIVIFKGLIEGHNQPSPFPYNGSCNCLTAQVKCPRTTTQLPTDFNPLIILQPKRSSPSSSNHAGIGDCPYPFGHFFLIRGLLTNPRYASKPFGQVLQRIQPACCGLSGVLSSSQNLTNVV